MLLRDLIPSYGDTQARKAWDELLSRDVLGAVVIGSAAGKVVEKVVIILALLTVGTDSSPLAKSAAKLAYWLTFIPVGVLLFVWWHELMEKISDGKEKVKEKKENVKEKTE
jgi:hypothetical protein